MLAITLYQPYATLVRLRRKRIETRSWMTGYRGPLAIHAGLGRPDWCRHVAEQDPLIRAVLEEEGLTFDTLPRGGFVATSVLYDLVRFVEPGTIETNSPRTLDPSKLTPMERACGDFEAGRFGWGLSNTQPLAELVPCRGGQRLWHVPDHLLPLLYPDATPEFLASLS